MRVFNKMNDKSSILHQFARLVVCTSAGFLASKLAEKAFDTLVSSDEITIEETTES